MTAAIDARYRLHRAVRKHRQRRIQRAGYFGAGKRRRRRRFVRAMYAEVRAGGEKMPFDTGVNLVRYLYGFCPMNLE